MRRAINSGLLIAVVVAIVGFIATRLWRTGLGHLAGDVLFRIGVWGIIACLVLLVLVWFGTISFRAGSRGATELVRYLPSGGFDLLLDYEPPELPKRLRGILSLVASGGFDLLLTTEAEQGTDEDTPQPVVG